MRKAERERFGNPVIWPHSLERPEAVRICDVVMDVGAGIRPMRLYTPKRHICVEPCAQYCDVLRAAGGYEVWEMTAEEALANKPVGIEAVYMFDVIEHMEKAMGLRVLQLAQEVAQYQVAIFTPIGFMTQTYDKWGLGEDSWQLHRSGWMPEEFPDWHIILRPRHGEKGFIAIWDREKTSTHK